MRLGIIVDIDTEKSSLDESEIRGDMKGFAKWILGKAVGIILEVKEVECIEEVEGEERDWRKHFEDRFQRME